jgi:creatinine amidohydrolase
MRFAQTLGLVIALAAGSVSAAHPGAAPGVVEIEKMTWPELKAALAAGKTTALFYIGGTEQRGPQNIIAGHNYIGREVVRHIAEKLGNAIAMPVLPFSPAQADPEIPGNIGLPAETLGLVMENISEQAIANGFKTVVLMGDSGGGQGPTGIYAAVAKKLNDKYSPKGTHVFYVDSPYTTARDAYDKIIEERGLPAGSHGSIQDTSEMMYLETLPGNSNWVRKELLPNTVGIPMVNGKPQRGPDSPKNGITGDARKSSVELGKLRHEMKVDFAVKQIQAYMAAAK